MSPDIEVLSGVSTVAVLPVSKVKLPISSGVVNKSDLTIPPDFFIERLNAVGVFII